MPPGTRLHHITHITNVSVCGCLLLATVTLMPFYSLCLHADACVYCAVLQGIHAYTVSAQ